MLYLDKVLAQLAYPLNLSLLLALVALILLGRQKRLGLPVLGFALAWLWFWATPVVSHALQLSLEGQFHDQVVTALPSADAIVVLGGGVRSALPARFAYPDLLPAADRVWHAARIFRAGKAPRVLVSGGNLPWLGERQPEADAIRELLIELGVTPDAIMLERNSRSTRENARYSAELLAGLGLKQVLLVTSALHMPRASATFQAVGIEVIPAPTDFRAVPEQQHLLRWLPDAQALLDSSLAIKEYLGLWVYRWRGWA